AAHRQQAAARGIRRPGADVLHVRRLQRGRFSVPGEAQTRMEGSLTRTTAADAYVAPGAQLSGDVRLASGSSVFHGTTVRGDAAYVEIGAQANIQDNCVIEALPGQPVVIGRRVSVGHNARVYGAT